MNIDDCLTPAQISRRLQYKSKYGTHAGPDGSFIYDVQQSSEFGSAGAVVPCLISHGTLVGERSQAIATGKETLGMMGEPVFDFNFSIRCSHTVMIGRGRPFLRDPHDLISIRIIISDTSRFE